MVLHNWRKKILFSIRVSICKGTYSSAFVGVVCIYASVFCVCIHASVFWVWASFQFCILESAVLGKRWGEKKDSLWGEGGVILGIRLPSLSFSWLLFLKTKAATRRGKSQESSLRNAGAIILLQSSLCPLSMHPCFVFNSVFLAFSGQEGETSQKINLRNAGAMFWDDSGSFSTMQPVQAVRFGERQGGQRGEGAMGS